MLFTTIKPLRYIRAYLFSFLFFFTHISQAITVPSALVDTEWLSNHLGHTVRTNLEYYRQHDAVLELSKVSRLLMASDSGKLGEYAGKKMSDIDIEGKCIP